MPARTTARVTGRRKAPAERREEILRAAGHAVLERGFGRVTVRELAAQLGVSSGLLHHYFTSVDEVLVAAFELLAAEDRDQLDRAVDARADPLVQLDQLLRYTVPGTVDDRLSLLWIDGATEALRTPALREPVRRLNQVWEDTLLAILRLGSRTGAWDVEDAVRSAKMLDALLSGLTLNVLVHDALTPEEALDLARHAAERELALPPGALAAVDPMTDAVDDGATHADDAHADGATPVVPRP